MELVVLDSLGELSDPDRAVSVIMRQARATHAVRLGAPDVRSGFVTYPGGGPALTFRTVHEQAGPPLASWRLMMGDVKLF